MTAQRRDWARIQDCNPHQLSTGRLSILQQKHLVAASCPSLSIELIANVRTVEAHSPTLVSVDDALLGTSRTAELRKSICRCVHGADCRRAVITEGTSCKRCVYTTHHIFDLSESHHEIGCLNSDKSVLGEEGGEVAVQHSKKLL